MVRFRTSKPLSASTGASKNIEGGRLYRKYYQTIINFKSYFLVLNLLFLLLAVDEITQQHEKIIEPLRWVLNTGGVFYFAWVIPGMALVVLLAAGYWRWLQQLPQTVKRQVLLAAGLYVLGALGFELIGGYILDSISGDTWLYAVSTTMEETLELVGLGLFLSAVLEYRKDRDVS